MNAQTIALALRLETGQFTAGLGMAGARVKAFGADVKKSAGETGQAFDTAAKKSDKGFKTMSTGAMIAGGAILAGFGLAFGAAMQFDKQMSEVGAVAGATGAELGKLRTAALDAGAATVFSAREAAQAEAELAKAGVSTRDILAGGLTGALDLAAAGSLELATAAEFAANAMTTFGLSGSAVPHIADVLAAAANKSATDVGEMGMALKQGGLVADQFGIGLEQTAGTLSLFAQAGLKGSDAGTSLKTMLQRLVPQSKEAAAMMESLGLSFFDANGQFVGMADVAEQLRTKLGPLNDEQRNLALSTIFGSDAVRGAAILMQGGAKSVDDWTKAVDESGYAADLAAKKNDNLAGDLEQLKGSFETTLIETGSKATGILRGLTQGVGDVVDGVGEMPGPLANAGTGLIGLIGVTATAIGLYGTFAEKVSTAKKAMVEMGGVSEKVGNNLGTIAAGAAAAIVVFAQLAQMFDAMNDGAKDSQAIFASVKFDSGNALSMKDALAQLGVEQDKLREKHRKQRDGILDLASAFADVVIPIHNVEGSLIDTKAALDDLDPKMSDLRMNSVHLEEVTNGVANALGLTTKEAERLVAASKVDVNAPFQDAVGGVVAYSNALSAGSPAAQGLQTSIKGLGDTTKSSAEKFKDLEDALKGFLDLAFSEEDAWDGLQQKLNDLREGLADGKFKFEGNSDAALDFREKMRGLVDQAGEVITEWARTGVQGDDLRTRVDLLSQGLINQATAMGIPKAEAERYAGKLKEIPSDVYTTIHSENIDSAIAKAGTLADLYDRLDRQLPSYMNPNAAAYGRGVGVLQANGGIVSYSAYAAGGIREAEYFANGSEQHIAQIAPAGSWRVWAEPETGGEAYIPFAASKRTRSVAIWREVGRRLGVGDGDYVDQRQIDNSRTVTVPMAYTGPDPNRLRRQVVDDIMWELG